MDHEQAEAADNVVEGMILICSRDARTLFDSWSTHSFVAPQFACGFQQPPKLLPYLFMVPTLVGKKVACENYYPKCTILIGGLLMPADQIVLAMHDFDVILGMDWLARYRACVGYFHKTITFKAAEPNSNVIFDGIRGKKSSSRIVFALKSVKLLKIGCEGYFAFISEKKPTKKLEEIPVVCEFPNIFPNEIPGLPPSREVDFPIDLVPSTAPISREVDFPIDLVPDTAQISKSSYRMVHAEL